jgi:hypothetical protein
MKNAILAIGAVAFVAGVALFALSAEKPASTFFLSAMDDYEREYLDFVVKYGRSFEDKTDYAFRLAIFAQNYNLISRQSNNGLVLGINKFADYSESEYKNMLGYLPLPEDEDLSKYKWHVPSFAVKDTVDWRKEGKVTPIKNQKACGSCWAFSANAYLESAELIFKKGSKDIDISEQQLVECSYWDYGTFGCNGGNYVTAWNYAHYKPLTIGSNYPYTASDEKECNKGKEAEGKYGVKDGVLVQQGSTAALVEALNRSPISVCIKAEEGNFRFYESGVIREDCGNEVDHAVLAVGYGEDYFIIKNSWGADWGDHGYAKIGFGKDESNGICGILTLPAYAEI